MDILFNCIPFITFGLFILVLCIERYTTRREAVKHGLAEYYLTEKHMKRWRWLSTHEIYLKESTKKNTNN